MSFSSGSLGAHEQAKRGAQARNESGKRRRVDPTTSDRTYTQEEVEFGVAMQSYKTTHGRPFPTNSEILDVLRQLGYQKVGLMA